MEPKIFYSNNSKIKFTFDRFRLGYWWLRSTCETYIEANVYRKTYTAAIEYQVIPNIEYINFNSYIIYNYPDYCYGITPVCMI